MTRYIKVCEQGKENEEITELPLEDNNTLPLADVVSQFPGAVGLKAKVGENSTRGVKIREQCLYPLEASEDSETIFIVVMQAKRPREDDEAQETTPNHPAKTSKLPQLEVIVLGLPFEEKEETIKEYFSNYGEVTEVDLKRQPNGKSRGFCFVKFKEEDGVTRATAETHTIGGRDCTVKVPYKRDERPGAPMVTKLFIGKLPESITDAQLRKCFAAYGGLKDVYIPQRPFRGIAYVEYNEREEMEQALAATHVVDGVELNVSMATPRTYNTNFNAGAAQAPYGQGRYGGYGGQPQQGGYQQQAYGGARPGNYDNHGYGGPPSYPQAGGWGTKGGYGTAYSAGGQQQQWNNQGARGGYGGEDYNQGGAQGAQGRGWGGNY